MKKLLIYMKPQRKRIAFATLFMAISVLCDLMLPTIMSNILDRGVYRSAVENTFPYIAKMCGIMFAIA